MSINTATCVLSNNNLEFKDEFGDKIVKLEANKDIITLSGDGPTVLLKNVKSPLDANDAASKSYVDNVAAGMHWEDPAKVATTTNIELSGIALIDGIAVVVGDIVLVKNQITQISPFPSSPTENGVYTVNADAWTRTEDPTPGSAIFVLQGNTQADTGWVCTNDTVDVGVTDITYVQFTGIGIVEAGLGLVKNGNVLDVGSSSSIIAKADNLEVASDGINKTHIDWGTTGDEVNDTDIPVENSSWSQIPNVIYNVDTCLIAIDNKLANIVAGGITLSNGIATTADGSQVNVEVDDVGIEITGISGGVGGSLNIKDSGITATKLADDAVTTVKILDANVTTEKLANDLILKTSTNTKASSVSIVNSDDISLFKCNTVEITATVPIRGLLTPTTQHEAVNKEYVDDINNNSTWKSPVRLATTGSTALFGLLTIDDVTLIANDRVLVKNQGNPAENGIYYASASQWTRSADMPDASDQTMCVVTVKEGTTYSKTLWKFQNIVGSNLTANYLYSGSDSIILDKDTINIDESYVVTIANDQTITGAKTFTNEAIFEGSVQFQDTDTATSSTSGPIYYAGGVSMAQNLYVGTDLNVGSNAVITGTITATAYISISDERKKKEITDITDHGDLLKQVRPVYYKWSAEKDGNSHAGVIAQEVMKVIPECVETDKDGFHSVDYQHFIALLIASNNELTKRVEQLEAKLK
jgi:hypothetical protein